MDWIVSHIWWLVGYVAVFIITAERKKMWEDLRPNIRYTWRGVLYTAIFIGTAPPLWKLTSVIRDGDPISSNIASVFLTNFACTVLVAAACFLMIVRLDRRVGSIERHLFSSSAKSAPPSNKPQ